jgi:cation diffusion facilitator CzcD-associated flavoprotein CzcO
VSKQFCIIGAGPAGLAAAAALKRRGLSFDHFEAHHSVGGIWDVERPESPMYESAHFISSRSLSGFSDFPMPEDYPDYPSHALVLSYLRAYASHHALVEGIRFGTRVERVVPDDAGVTLRVGGTEVRYRGVVCASGQNWDPLVPPVPGRFSGELRHAVSYRKPEEFRAKRVLVVGLGNSGADIACDAVREAKSVHVSVRRGYHFVPKYLFGKPADVFAHEGPQLPLWLERILFSVMLRMLVGDTTRVGMPKPDHAVLDSHPLMNDQLLHHLRHGDAKLCADVAEFDGPSVLLRDGTRLEVDFVLFATGYSRQIPYLDASFLDGAWGAGQFLTCFSRRFPGLFTLGFTELNGALYPHLSRQSALIADVMHLMLHAPARAIDFYDWIKRTELDLSGGRSLIDSPRHAHYCDEHALLRATKKVAARLGTQIQLRPGTT